MEHLKYLSWFNYFFGATTLLLSMFVGLAGLAVVGSALAAGGDADLTPVLISGVAVGVAFAITLGLALTYVVAGRRVASGRGRILQSILALLAIGNVPIGTLYGAYALWVCWMNEDTKKAFDEPYGIV